MAVEMSDSSQLHGTYMEFQGLIYNNITDIL